MVASLREGKAALETANLELESRVAARTAELTAVNRQMEEQIKNRAKAEKALLATNTKIEHLHALSHRLAACQSEEDILRLSVEAVDTLMDLGPCRLQLAETDEQKLKAAMEMYAPGTFDKQYTHRMASELGDLILTCSQGKTPPEHELHLLDLLLDHTAQAIKRLRLQNELREQANHDPLTGVYNRRYLQEQLQLQLERARRYNHSLGVLLIDVDQLKKVNDTHGHQAGDQTLQQIARLLVDSVRQVDIVARYGGDEFVIILPEQGEQAQVVRQRILESATAYTPILDLLGSPVGLSIGQACWQPGSQHNTDDLLEAADQDMYFFKQSKYWQDDISA
jgi:diguanylate cyclase (GGDEF)-like protein